MSEPATGVGQSFPQMHEQRTVTTEAAFFVPRLQKGMRLLDCGCGPGTITLGLAEVVAPGEVVGVDIDAKRFAPAIKAAAERGLTNVSFEPGDIHNLRFPESSFDAVFESAVLMHLQHPEKALAE